MYTPSIPHTKFAATIELARRSAGRLYRNRRLSVGFTRGPSAVVERRHLTGSRPRRQSRRKSGHFRRRIVEKFPGLGVVFGLDHQTQRLRLVFGPATRELFPRRIRRVFRNRFTFPDNTESFRRNHDITTRLIQIVVRASGYYAPNTIKITRIPINPPALSSTGLAPCNFRSFRNVKLGHEGCERFASVGDIKTNATI